VGEIGFDIFATRRESLQPTSVPIVGYESRLQKRNDADRHAMYELTIVFAYSFVHRREAQFLSGTPTRTSEAYGFALDGRSLGKWASSLPPRLYRHYCLSERRDFPTDS
jgi:hypothetical protein